MSPEERRARGQRIAEQFFGNEDVQNAVAAVLDEITRDMLHTKPEAAQVRERLYMEHHGLRRVLDKLQRMVDDGLLAARQIEDDKSS